MTRDAFGADATARERWFLRTPDEIDDERRAAEQAGREAYGEAIRTGQDVQARTPDELIQLGRARLAQQAGVPPNLDGEPPLANPADNYQVAGLAVAKTPPYPHALDPIVESEVAKFNKMNQADPGDDIYLDPDLVKAQIMVESGYNLKAYNSDPMQVNKPGDWDGNLKTGDPGHKVTLGLQKGGAPGPELGIRAGLGWLDAKSYIHDPTGKLGPFIGWERAFKRYNDPTGRGGNPHYWEDIQNAYRYIKSGGR